MSKLFNELTPLEFQNIQARFCRDIMSLSNLELTGIFNLSPPTDDGLATLVDKIGQFKFSERCAFTSFIKHQFSEPYLNKVNSWNKASRIRKKNDLTGANVTKATLRDINEIKDAIKNDNGTTMTVPEIMELAVKKLKTEFISNYHAALKKLPYVNDKELYRAINLYLWLVYEQRVTKERAANISVAKYGVDKERLSDLISIASKE